MVIGGLNVTQSTESMISNIHPLHAHKEDSNHAAVSGGQISIREDVPRYLTRAHGSQSSDLNKDLDKVKSPSPYKVRSKATLATVSSDKNIVDRYVPVQVEIVSEKHSRNDLQQLTT